MFLTVQFPFADVRSFLQTDTHRLSSPTWPLPIQGEFVRSFGQVRKRRRGGVEGWIGEEMFCEARRALRFDYTLSTHVKSAGQYQVPICTFRRLFFDGKVNSLLEVGFTCKTQNNPTGNEFLSLINSCLALPVRIPIGPLQLYSTELMRSDRYLAKLYLRSSTGTANGEFSIAEDWWVTSGAPLILVEFDLNEMHSDYPKYCRLVHPLNRNNMTSFSTIKFCNIERHGRLLGAWLVCRDGFAREDRRRLRTHLLRLHAHRECLKQVLRLIAQKKLQFKARTESSDKLQQYLSDSMKFLSREQSFGVDQNKILEAANQFDAIISSTERSTVISELDSIRKNILRNLTHLTESHKDGTGKVHILGDGNTVVFGNIEKIGGATMTKYDVKIGDHATVHGDIVVANTIQSSFNKIAGAEATKESKDKLTELHKAVSEMVKHLSEDKARDTSRDLESLTNETLSKTPRRKWYELSADGLIEAAKTVGAIGEPVIKVVKEILGLLA